VSAENFLQSTAGRPLPPRLSRPKPPFPAAHSRSRKQDWLGQRGGDFGWKPLDARKGGALRIAAGKRAKMRVMRSSPEWAEMGPQGRDLSL
jgi:hypothetical protein